MKNTYKAIFLPNRKVILDYYQGYVLDGDPLYGIKDSDVYSETEYYEIDDERSKLEIVFSVLVLIISIPLLLILIIISAIFKKIQKKLQDLFFLNLDKFISLFFKKKKIKKIRKIRKKEFSNAEIDNIPDFLGHCKKNHVKVYIYSYQPLSQENIIARDELINKGLIESIKIISRLSDLSTLIQSDNISILNSILIISDVSEVKEAKNLGFDSESYFNTNVHLWKKRDMSDISNSLVCNSYETLVRLKKEIEYYLKAESNAFFTNEIVFYIEDKKDEFLNEYLRENLTKINQRLVNKGVQLLHFPSFTAATLKNHLLILDFIRYRIPILYSLTDDELEEILTTLLQNLPAKDFYNIVLEELKLPYFEKPCLLRNIYGGSESSKNKFTYSPIKYNTTKDLDIFFDWYIEQLKIPNDHANIFFQNNKKREYDADWNFDNESKLDTDEIKQKIDTIKAEGKFGVLAEAIMYMLETIKDEKPEILSKIKPLIEQNNMLESKVILSPIYIDKHYNIFLPSFGNQEVKMHALPKAVYLLFLKHRNGIRFKELYQYKSELLDIYYKITNKDNKEEIEKAIDDLVDMTNPSINQKCSRIREAFRKIMDEHVAKYYYIDGANGEPKRINLPDNLIDIRY